MIVNQCLMGGGEIVGEDGARGALSPWAVPATDLSRIRRFDEKQLSPETQGQMRVERPVRLRTNLHPQGLTHAAVIHRHPWRAHGRALAT